MKKPQPKAVTRPSSASKFKGKDKLDYQLAKNIIQIDDKGNNKFIKLQNTSLLPILSTYETRILKHIIITDKQINFSNHKNCEIHKIEIKTIISYFIEWKKTIITNLKQFETVLCEKEENGSVRKLRRKLLSIVGSVKSLNEEIIWKLQKYIVDQSQHYITQQLQSHKQYPPNKPQPLAKQSNDVITQNNYTKLSTILTDYRYLKRLIQTIMDIFNTLQKVLIIKTKHKFQGKTNDDEVGGIFLEDVEKILLIKNQNNKYGPITKNQTEIIDEYVATLIKQLWQIVDKKITQASTLCNATNDLVFMKQYIEDNNTNQTPSKKTTKTFMVQERLTKTSKQRTSLKLNREYSQFDQRQTVCKKYFCSTNKLQPTTVKNSSTSKAINLNIIQFRLKKLFPYFIHAVIEQIENALKYRDIMRKYAEYLSKMVLQINKSLSIEYEYQSSQEERYDENRTKKLLKIEKRYNNFQSMIRLLLVELEKYKNQIRQISSAVESMRQRTDQQQCMLILNKILTQNNQQQVNKLIQYLRAALQLYFYQLMDIFVKEMELQESVLEFVKDEGTVYKWVKECLGLMISVEMENFNMSDEGLGDRDANIVRNTNNRLRIMNTSQWTTFLVQFSYSYSTLFTTMTSLPREINLLCRQNNIEITPQQKEKSSYDQTISYFESIVQTVEEFLLIRKKVIKELKQNLINRWFIDRTKENVVMMQGKSNLIEEIHKQLKQNIQYTVLKLTPQQKQISSQQQHDQQKTQQLTVLRQFLQLIKSSQHNIQFMTIFTNPQSYLSSLSTTGNQFLNHPTLLADISILNKQYKQYMNILCGSELVQYVIKENQAKIILIEKVVGNQIGQLFRDKIRSQLAFPNVPIILNPPQHSLSNNNNYSPNSKITIPISQILNKKLTIISYPIIQKTRLKALQLHKIIGDTIDNLEEIKQMEMFNQQLREDIQNLKEVLSGEVIEKLINEIVKMVGREWREIIKNNQFEKNLKLTQLMKIIHLLQNREQSDPPSTQQRQTIKINIQYLKQLLTSLQQTNTKPQQQSINLLNKKANRNMELLTDMIKSLQLKRFNDLRIKLKQFLQQNGIVMVQYDLEVNGKRKQQQLEVNKLRVKSEKGESRLVDQKNKESKLVILVKKVKKSKRINIKQQKQPINEDSDDRISIMLILREGNVKSFLSKILPIRNSVEHYKTSDNNYKKLISRDDLQYLQYHYTQIQQYINEIIDKLKSFCNCQQQQSFHVLFNQIIDQLNKQIGSFSRLIAKIIIECWLKQKMENDDELEKSGWRIQMLLGKILHVFESSCVNIVRECVIRKKARAYGQDDNIDNINKITYCFASSINKLEQENNFIKILLSNKNKSYKYKPLEEQPQQGSQSKIDAQTLHNIYEQIGNTIEFLCWYPLKKSTTYQIIKLSPIDNKRQQQLIYWCIMKNEIRKLGDNNSSKISLLQLIENCIVSSQQIYMSQSKVSKQHHHQFEQSISYYNQLQPTQMEKLSQRYQQSCFNHRQQVSRTQTANYYYVTIIHVQKLLQQFILRGLIVENGLILNDNRQRASNNYINIRNCVNRVIGKIINQLNAIGLRKTKTTNIYNRSSCQRLPYDDDEFANNIRCVEYFYYQHYLKFIDYLSQIYTNNIQLPPNLALSYHQVIAFKIDKLIHLWTRIQRFPLVKEGINHYNTPIEQMISELYQIVKQLITKEKQLAKIEVIKSIMRGVNNDSWMLLSVIDNVSKRDNRDNNTMIGMLLLPFNNSIGNNTQKMPQHDNQDNLAASTALSYYQQSVLQKYFWLNTQSGNSTNMQLLQQPHIRKRFVELFTNSIQVNIKQLMIKQIQVKIENRFIVLDLFPIVKTPPKITIIPQKQRLCEFGKNYYELQRRKQQIRKLIDQVDQLLLYAKWKQNMANGQQYKKGNESKNMREFSGQMEVLLECISIDASKERESIRKSNRMDKQQSQQSSNRQSNSDKAMLKLIELLQGFQLVAKRLPQNDTNTKSVESFKERSQNSGNSQYWYNNNKLIEQLVKMRENEQIYLEFMSKQWESDDNSLYIQRLLIYANLSREYEKTNNKAGKSNGNKWTKWWKQLMLNTICFRTNKEKSTHRTQETTSIQPLLLVDSADQNRIIKSISRQLQQIEHRINTKKLSKFNNNLQATTRQDIIEQVEMFISFAQRIIHQFQQQMTTKVFIELPSSQQQELYNDELINVRHEIKCQNQITATTTTTTTIQSMNLSSKAYQLEINTLFSIINGRWIQSTDNNNSQLTTKSSLLTRIFVHFIINQQILQPSRIKLINQIQLQLSSHINTLVKQIKNVYSQIPIKEKQLIVEWNTGKIDHDKKIRKEINKRHTFQILFMILIKWAHIIQMQRVKPKQEQENKQLQEQKQPVQQEQQPKSSQNINIKKKPYVVKPESSSSLSKLQIQFALSDTWCVDQVEFIDRLKYPQREKFYRIEKKIIESKEQKKRNNQQRKSNKNDKNMIIDDKESQLQISFNLSENHADTYDDKWKSDIKVNTLKDYKGKFINFNKE